jgi:hypothetical protein
MDAFLSQKFCDRCGKELTLGKITSMYNNDCILTMYQASGKQKKITGYRIKRQKKT